MIRKNVVDAATLNLLTKKKFGIKIVQGSKRPMTECGGGTGRDLCRCCRDFIHLIKFNAEHHDEASLLYSLASIVNYLKLSN